MKVISLILIVGAFFAGMYLNSCQRPLTNFSVIPVGKTEYKYIKIPASCDEYKDCYNHHIEIVGKMTSKNIFDVWAGDTCKSTGQKFEITQQRKKHLLQFQPLVSIGWNKNLKQLETGYGGQILYYYNFGFLGIGGGTGLIKIGEFYNAMITAGLLVQF